MSYNSHGEKPEKSIPQEKTARELDTNLAAIKNIHGERANTTNTCTKTNIGVKRLTVLKIPFPKQGHTFDQFGLNDGLCPLLYRDEHLKQSRFSSMFGGAGNFSTQLGGGRHAL
jgi:hypothetical protein